MNPAAERIQSEVQRAIQRSVKGLEYLGSPAPAVGPTPKDVIYEQGTLHLYHYRPLADELYRIPILIVMATSNRGYILDLTAGQSFVEYLLRQGYDVYLIDWSPPIAADRNLRFEDYTLRFIPECVQRVRDDSGESDVTIIGYCMGGVLSVMYAALHPHEKIANLVCFTTPIDFSRMELFAKWSDRRYFDVDKLVDATGNVPSEIIFGSFEMLRPATRIAGQIQLWENMWDEKFVRSYRAFERWSTDTLPLAGEYFRETVKELIWENRLHKNEMVIAGKRVDLGAITAPVLHAMAEHDHIVPYDAAKPLIGHVGSTDKEEIVLKGGHVSLVAGANAVNRLWPRLDAWLGVRSV
ncbi:MAG: poly[(R)-3-hydroxyalkanoate] polymerase subunit PhaC [Candidatus Eremiobacteraeota bacterium]|nr:poly[(R)-3-hydroxyalkanoate] polymerase subunit PhaC [Candidatus Eremiobacteraeota bacterium]MEA2718575.1 poly[(R)-3-hydroxyalkanoate] polymerase subunit PhaC [Candidatus Eremiobacteraeota bacterium]